MFVCLFVTLLVCWFSNTFNGTMVKLWSQWMIGWLDVRFHQCLMWDTRRFITTTRNRQQQQRPWCHQRSSWLETPHWSSWSETQLSTSQLKKIHVNNTIFIKNFMLIIQSLKMQLSRGRDKGIHVNNTIIIIGYINNVFMLIIRSLYYDIC